jgi:stress response protein SCP2
VTELARGANVALASAVIDVAVTGASTGSVDLLAFQVTANGRVRSDADMVFFNQRESPEGAVRLTGPGSIQISLTDVPEQIATLAVSVALDESVAGNLATIPGLAAAVRDGGADGDLHQAPATGLTSERAAILVEIYRRGDGWKLRNVSAGWDAGLAALAREYGVTVDEPGPAPAQPVSVADPVDPAAATTPATPAAAPPAVPADPAATNGQQPVPLQPAPPQPAPPQPVPPQPAPTPPPEDTQHAEQPAATPAAAAGAPRSVAGEEKLSLQKRQQLDLRKQQVHKVLLTKDADQVRARVILVLDKTGSMSREYKKGVVHRVVERMVPVAIQLDDDGSLECYLYAESFFKLPDLQVAQLEPWIAEYVHISGKHAGLDYRRIGTVNDEIPILSEITGSLQAGDPTPTLVLFFTDGGFHRKKPITDLIVEAAALPAFWQFVGIGKAGAFGILESLDALEGRVVDNVGFFPVRDIDTMDDAELYRLLLSEFPDWLRQAKSKGIVG